MARRALLRKADPPKAGKKRHVHQHQHANSGDGSRLEVAIGLLERDNDKRRNKVDQQQELEDDRPKRPRVP
jgi:hypothetical protein